jgi:hypothetical protein
MAKRQNDLVATVPRLAGLPVIPNRQAGSLSHHSRQAPTRIVYYDKTFENYSNLYRLPRLMTVTARHSCESRNLDPRFRGDDRDRIGQNPWQQIYILYLFHAR